MIRTVIGIILVMGTVGTLDTDPNASFLVQILIGLLGIFLIAWAASDVKS